MRAVAQGLGPGRLQVLRKRRLAFLALLASLFWWVGSGLLSLRRWSDPFWETARLPWRELGLLVFTEIALLRLRFGGRLWVVAVAAIGAAHGAWAVIAGESWFVLVPAVLLALAAWCWIPEGHTRREKIQERRGSRRAWNAAWALATATVISGLASILIRSNRPGPVEAFAVIWNRVDPEALSGLFPSKDSRLKAAELAELRANGLWLPIGRLDSAQFLRDPSSVPVGNTLAVTFTLEGEEAGLFTTWYQGSTHWTLEDLYVYRPPPQSQSNASSQPGTDETVRRWSLSCLGIDARRRLLS
ncbi:MAG: hypothetical protein L0191_03300 [Acidobacteria bacterium]|nr:hypothetical protein [Acidobacteriota bacterium]